jgi:hypothetical protein
VIVNRDECDDRRAQQHGDPETRSHSCGGCGRIRTCDGSIVEFRSVVDAVRSTMPFCNSTALQPPTAPQRS